MELGTFGVWTSYAAIRHENAGTPPSCAHHVCVRPLGRQRIPRDERTVLARALGLSTGA